MKFKNLKEAHKYYNYPSSHRFGTIGNEKGVIRSYSNGKGCDYYKKNTKEVYYKIKNNKIRELFNINILNKKKVRFFRKVHNGVEDLGLYTVKKITNNDFAKLIK